MAAAPVMILIGVGLAAVLLVAAEFSTLYTVHDTASHASFGSPTTASHDKGALFPIVALVLFLGFGAWATGSRFTLGALAVLGGVALLFALLHDLPDAQAKGVLRAAGGGLSQASASPGAGLYLESAGGIVLLVCGVLGLLLTAPSARRAPRRAPRRARRPVRARAPRPLPERSQPAKPINRRGKRAPGEPLRRRTGGD